MIFLQKKSKSNKKKILAVGRGGCGGVARVSDFFSLFKRSKCEKNVSFFLEGGGGVKVREDWLV